MGGPGDCRAAHAYNGAMTDADNPLRAYFEHNRGRMIDKWLHYFDVYHRHFQRFRGRRCTVLEIGIYHGGSLQMWREYFGPAARIVGVDNDARCAQLAADGHEIVIGDQADRGFLRRLRAQLGAIDILIDDGGHTMVQQAVTFEELFPAISADGVYLCEDMHTSYWREYGGAYRLPYSFLEFSKLLIDQLNAWHSRDPHSFAVTEFTRSAVSMHYYDSMLVIEKAPRTAPSKRRTGVPSFHERPDDSLRDPPLPGADGR
jgi:hypothetical protein